VNEPTFPSGLRSSSTDLASVLALGAALGIAGEVSLPRRLRLGSVSHTDRLTRRQRDAATAKRSQALDGRVFQHRTTGQIRAANWQPDGVEFLDPKTGSVMLRAHHKALSWCSNADDITPSGGGQ
jgi:hypothetical protein